MIHSIDNARILAEIWHRLNQAWLRYLIRNFHPLEPQYFWASQRLIHHAAALRRIYSYAQRPDLDQ